MAKKITRKKQPITWHTTTHIRHDPNLIRFHTRKNNPKSGVKEISPFDAISVRPLSQGGYQAVIYSKHPHEIAHVKEVVRSHRRKIPLTSWSLLAAFHESLGMPPAQRMREYPKAIIAFDSPTPRTTFRQAIAALKKVPTPKKGRTFILARTHFLQVLHRAIATQFPSRTAFWRAVIKMENDPVMGKVYRELDNYHQDNIQGARREVQRLIWFLAKEADSAREKKSEK